MSDIAKDEIQTKLQQLEQEYFKQAQEAQREFRQSCTPSTANYESAVLYNAVVLDYLARRDAVLKVAEVLGVEIKRTQRDIEQ